jgi:GT2 family glycosyltransferase
LKLPDALRKQNETIRTLRKELALKNQELANQKWVFEQFLQSPSWRITAPLRWIAQQFRRLNPGASQHPLSREPHIDVETVNEVFEPVPELPVAEFKEAFASLCQVALENFLASGAKLSLPADSNPLISVVLVLFNRAELTLACLRSLAETNQSMELVIVDNASSDPTALLLDRLEGPRILRNSENRNFLLAVNQAARECRGKYLLLLNNDAQLLPGALETLLASIEGSHGIGAVGGKIILLDGTLQEAGSIVWRDGSCLGYGRGDNPFAPPYMFRRDVDYCSGAFLLTPRQVWQELGGFDEAFTPAYYEETDYCMRLWRKDLRVVYEPAAAVLHFEFASSQSAAAAIDLQTRNRKQFVERNRSELLTNEDPAPDRIIFARSRQRGRRVLYLDDRVPHRWLGSGFPRAHSMLQVLQNAGYFITIFPLDDRHESWTDIYSDLPREVEVMIGLQRSVLEAFLRSRKGYYDTIIISRPHNMQFVTPLLAAHPDWFESTLVIYDAEAVCAFRDKGHRELAGTAMSAEEYEKALSTEMKLAAQADLVISVSEGERDTFRAHGIPRVEVLGHSIEVAVTNTPFSERSGVLFVGAVHKETSPNADSLVWFLENVFPRIQATISDITVTVAGVNISQRVRALAGPAVRMIGHVSDLTPFYAAAKLFIAPTRYAAGIPHKIHESAARGLPVVATPLLVQQLGWTKEEISFSEDPDEFAALCIELYSNEGRWTQQRNAGLVRVRRECAPESFASNLRRILNTRKTAPAPVG